MNSLPMTRILVGDVRDRLLELPDESIDCVVTSPPYWGLRDYGVDGQIGLETSLFDWVAEMVAVFGEVRRVLKPEGTLWLNLGDSYAQDGGAGFQGKNGARANRRFTATTANRGGRRKPPEGIARKNLLGQPWRVAFALQDDGWILRADNIWAKTNPMPESVKDRTTKSHEYVFHFARSEHYFYDADAIKEPVSGTAHARGSGVNPKARTPSGWDTGPGNHRELAGRYPRSKQNESFSGSINELVDERNARSVWTIGTQACSEAHFATFPEALPERCIKAGCPEGGIVLDPFFGAGTTGLVAAKLGRSCVGIELNPEYAEIAERRIRNGAGLLTEVEIETGRASA